MCRIYPRLFCCVCPNIMHCAIIDLNINKGHPFLKQMSSKQELDGIVVACAVSMLNNVNRDLDFSSIRGKVQKMMQHSRGFAKYSWLCDIIFDCEKGRSSEIMQGVAGHFLCIVIVFGCHGCMANLHTGEHLLDYSWRVGRLVLSVI